MKKTIWVRVEEDLLLEAQAIATKNGWTFQKAVELAFTCFVGGYRQVNITQPDSLPMEAPIEIK